MPESADRAEQRIPPVRGLVPLHNHRGKAYGELYLKRWVRLSRIAYRTPKLDLLSYGVGLGAVEDLLDYAAFHLECAFSLRTDCSEPPEALGEGQLARLHDVFLCPRELAGGRFRAWLEAAREAGLPIRAQLQGPLADDLDLAALAAELAEAGVVVLNVAATDAFMSLQPCADAAAGRAAVERMNEMVRQAAAHGMEANLLGLPLCRVAEDNLPRAVNTPQFYAEHQHYDMRAYELAVEMYARAPWLVAKLLTFHLARHTSWDNPVDRLMLLWLMHKRPFLYFTVAVFRKLTRHIRLWPATRERSIPLEEAQARRRQKERAKAEEALGPECARCSLRRICDHETEEYKRLYPGVGVEAREGELVASPLHFNTEQRRKYYDPIDEDRRRFEPVQQELAQKADDIVSHCPPDGEVDSFTYAVEGRYCQQMPGAVRWFSLSGGERHSHPLGGFETPVTFAVTFGGGIADFIGFAFGRHAKIVCRMEAYTHKLVLHIDEEGRYVLLRDGRLVRPVEFEAGQFVPHRLAGRVWPRLSITNIDVDIVTQNVQVWEGAPPAEAARDVKYSIIVFATRFARRLQATLQSVAHQDFDLDRIEVIVAYVPGLDATDDVIDSIHLAFPELRIVRAPFPERNMKSKGFNINECVRLAAGEWVVLLDADILMRPDMFQRVEEVESGAHFIAPDGRKMLTPELTAKVLLGEYDWWNRWDEVLKGEGEFRYREAMGMPIGFWQAVRRSCFDTVQYEELEHFEGADWRFGDAIRESFGPEVRLEGVPVLHLDHGGSQWYGVDRHR